MGEIATEEVPNVDVLRRNRPGSTRADWSNWPDQEFGNMESIHAAQMLIQVNIISHKKVYNILISAKNQKLSTLNR